MSKFKIYIINALGSAMIGAVIEVIDLILREKAYISFNSLLESMLTGVFIGTVSLFCLLQIILKLTDKPIYGFLSNFLVVAVLVIIGAILDSFGTFQLFINSSWLMVLIVAEFLSFFLILLWYHQIKLYKIKLQSKKASLDDE